MINLIKKWLTSKNEKFNIVAEFNESYANDWDKGDSPFLISASIVKGNKDYKHSSSDTFSGFRVTINTKQSLNDEVFVTIEKSIASDQELIRKLIRVGFDTLEIFRSSSSHGFESSIKSHLKSFNR
jgi:hypothetical protein